MGMPAIIEDFWPKSIDVRILTPLTILRSQAAFLGKRTGGLLEGHISTDRAADKASHRFYIVATAPDRVVVPILEAIHSAKEVYPVEVVSKAFEPKPAAGPFARIGEMSAALSEFAGGKAPNRRTAATQDAFIALVKQVLNSEAILASLNSIIAMSNEAESPAIQSEGDSTAEMGTAERATQLVNDLPSDSPSSPET